MEPDRLTLVSDLRCAAILDLNQRIIKRNRQVDLPGRILRLVDALCD
jgi:hypothetical protein